MNRDIEDRISLVRAALLYVAQHGTLSPISTVVNGSGGAIVGRLVGTSGERMRGFFCRGASRQSARAEARVSAKVGRGGDG